MRFSVLPSGGGEGKRNEENPESRGSEFKGEEVCDIVNCLKPEQVGEY